MVLRLAQRSRETRTWGLLVHSLHEHELIWSTDIIFLRNHSHLAKTKKSHHDYVIQPPAPIPSYPLSFYIRVSAPDIIISSTCTLIWSLAGGLWTRGQNVFRFIPANLLPITISAHLPPLPRAGPPKGYSFASLKKKKKKKAPPIITALQSVGGIWAIRTIPHRQI